MGYGRHSFMGRYLTCGQLITEYCQCQYWNSTQYPRTYLGT